MEYRYTDGRRSTKRFSMTKNRTAVAKRTGDQGVSFTFNGDGNHAGTRWELTFPKHQRNIDWNAIKIPVSRYISCAAAIALGFGRAGRGSSLRAIFRRSSAVTINICSSAKRWNKWRKRSKNSMTLSLDLKNTILILSILTWKRPGDFQSGANVCHQRVC